MSETVHYKGTLTPTGKTLKDFVANDTIDEMYEGDIQEYFDEQYYRKAILIEGMVYTIEKELFHPEDDIFRAVKVVNGVIDFEVKYYNGGCSFDEAIEMALVKTN